MTSSPAIQAAIDLTAGAAGNQRKLFSLPHVPSTSEIKGRHGEDTVFATPEGIYFNLEQICLTEV